MTQHSQRRRVPNDWKDQQRPVAWLHSFAGQARIRDHRADDGELECTVGWRCLPRRQSENLNL